jgi:hypothetical protein
MVVLIFLAWTAHGRTIDELRDFTDYLNNHNDTPGKLIITLAALLGAVVGLLVIVMEVAPEDEDRELRIEQAGATMIVPADALRGRLVEALTALPEVTAARARVSTRDKGIQAAVDIMVGRRSNIAAVTQEAGRVVIDTIQTDLGLPVAGAPTVRITFEDSDRPHPLATSAVLPPHAEPAVSAEPPLSRVETVDERMEAASTAEPPPAMDSTPGDERMEAASTAEPPPAMDSTPGASPGRIVHSEAPAAPAPEKATEEHRADDPLA